MRRGHVQQPERVRPAVDPHHHQLPAGLLAAHVLRLRLRLLRRAAGAAWRRHGRRAGQAARAAGRPRCRPTGAGAAGSKQAQVQLHMVRAVALAGDGHKARQRHICR